MKSCDKCIYRDECEDLSDVCSEYVEGDPEDIAEYETDFNDYTGGESEDEFFEHEDGEFPTD